jgi:hypothetical protein
MKKLTYTIIILIALQMFSGCKKSDTAPTAKNDITGSWKLTKTVVDLNGNGTIDASDPVINDATMSNNIIAYFTNGKAFESYDVMVNGAVYKSDTFHFNWAWAGNTDLTCNYTDTGMNAAFYMHISTINSASMTLKDTCYNCYGYHIYTLPQWKMYTKQ